MKLHQINIKKTVDFLSPPPHILRWGGGYRHFYLIFQVNYRPLPEPSYAKIGKEKIECNKCKPNCYVNAMKGAGNKMLVSFNYYNVFSTL